MATFPLDKVIRSLNNLGLEYKAATWNGVLHWMKWDNWRSMLKSNNSVLNRSQTLDLAGAAWMLYHWSMGYFCRSCTAFSQAFMVNSFRWRIRDERPLFRSDHVTRNVLTREVWEVLGKGDSWWVMSCHNARLNNVNNKVRNQWNQWTWTNIEQLTKKMRVPLL